MRSTLSRGKRFGGCFLKLYIDARIPRSAAALSYYLTMTFFPVVICLYTMLGSSADKVMRILNFASRYMSPSAYRVVLSFLDYVMANNSVAMLIAAVTIVLTSSSAAVRRLHSTIDDMQGGQRFRGVMGILFSIVFAILFLVMMYFSIVVMLTGRAVITFVTEMLHLTYFDIWDTLRFGILFALAFCLIWVLYVASRRRGERYRTFPGALVATLGVVLVVYLFSLIFNVSTKYPLVYGSFTAIMLIMFWLYSACIIIFCGAAVNVAIRDAKAEAAGLAEAPGPSGETEKGK